MKSRSWMIPLLLCLPVACLGEPGRDAGADPARRTSRNDFTEMPEAFTVERCALDVRLQPSIGRIEAVATLTLRTTGGPGRVQLELHPDLAVDSIRRAGDRLAFSRSIRTASTGGAGAATPGGESAARDSTDSPIGVAAPRHVATGGSPGAMVVYDLRVGPGGARVETLVVAYGGRLQQDVDAGERPGEIHNFAMRAHISAEGVYLSPEGGWYPRIADIAAQSNPDGTDGSIVAPAAEAPITDFELTVEEPPGMVLVASGNRDGAAVDAPRGPRTTWRSPFPMPGLTLAGGPHRVFQRQAGHVLVSAHLNPEHAEMAPGLLDAVEHYLELYQPRLGPYPYFEFTIVENFFSSGFAFPAFTLLSSQVIAMGPRALRPGYLDHELLHNWWGNGVFVSRRDGDWSECLTSYCTNYMRHILEGDLAAARAQRRDVCFGLGRLSPGDDRPLGDFGREGGPGRFIGYQKGAMFLALLSRQVGEDALWRGLRRFREGHLGRRATWEELRAAMEQETRRDLRAQFQAWVRGTGVPQITLDDAAFDPNAQRLFITLSQQGAEFEASVPVRLVYSDGSADAVVELSRRRQIVSLPASRAPEYVELDPDYHLPRRIPPDEAMPTIAAIRPPAPLTILRASGDHDAYEQAAARLRERYSGADAERVRDVILEPGVSVSAPTGHALILGDACRDPRTAGLFEGGPFAVTATGFRAGETPHDGPDRAVLCCLRNPHDANSVICIYYGNDARALAASGLVAFYEGNSMIVFESGRPVERRDFETTARVRVERLPPASAGSSASRIPPDAADD